MKTHYFIYFLIPLTLMIVSELIFLQEYFGNRRPWVLVASTFGVALFILLMMLIMRKARRDS